MLAELDFETLQSVGVTEADLDGLAENALADYFISVAPAPWSITPNTPASASIWEPFPA